MVLRETGGYVGEAARIAGIHQRGLYNKVERLALWKVDLKK
jgi:DNA-binding NtrC family response regulator